MTDEIPQLQGSPQGYASAERVVVVEKKFEKTFENLLTNLPSCDTIRAQKRCRGSSNGRTPAEQEVNVGSTPTLDTKKNLKKVLDKPPEM